MNILGEIIMNKLFKIIIIVLLFIPNNASTTPIGAKFPVFSLKVPEMFYPLRTVSTIKIYNHPMDNKDWIAEYLNSDLSQLDFEKYTATVEFYNSAEAIEQQKSIEDFVNISPNHPIFIKGENIPSSKECYSPYPSNSCNTNEFFNIIVNDEGVYKLTIKYESIAFKDLAKQIALAERQMTEEEFPEENFMEEQTLMIIAKDGVYAIFRDQNDFESNIELFNSKIILTYKQLLNIK